MLRQILCAVENSAILSRDGCPIQVVPSPRTPESVPGNPSSMRVYIKDGGTWGVFTTVPAKKSILIGIVAFTESRLVACPEKADRTLFLCAIVSELALFQAGILALGISFSSCNVRAVGGSLHLLETKQQRIFQVLDRRLRKAGCRKGRDACCCPAQGSRPSGVHG